VLRGDPAEMLRVEGAVVGEPMLRSRDSQFGHEVEEAAGKGQGEHAGRPILTHHDRMLYTLRRPKEVSLGCVEPFLSAMESDRTFQYVQRLVIVVMDMEGRGVPGRVETLDHGDDAVGVRRARQGDDQVVEKPHGIGVGVAARGHRHSGSPLHWYAHATLRPSSRSVDTNKLVDCPVVSLANGTSLAAHIDRLGDAEADLDVVSRRALDTILAHVPADAWCWNTTDPASLMITGSAIDGLPESMAAEFFRIELTEPDFLKLVDLPARTPPAGTLWNETGGDLAASTRWRCIFGPLGLGDELRMAFVAGGVCWGYLSLHRKQEAPPFNPREIELVAALGPSIARAIRGVHMRSAVEERGRRAVVLLAGDRTVLAVSEEAEDLLADLEPAAARDRSDLPAAVYAAVGHLEAGGSGEVTALGASGAWLRVRASRFAGEGVAWTAVTVEPASPLEARHHILAAWSLTRREAEVAEMVLRGLSTRRIAAELYISPHTVQQHLKSVFEKSGVRSRRDLIARVNAGA
jgi:DNA-binding CsgD family transcriptional regulator